MPRHTSDMSPNRPGFLTGGRSRSEKKLFCQGGNRSILAKAFVDATSKKKYQGIIVMSAIKPNLGEMTKAEAMLQQLRAKLDQIKGTKAEQTAEMRELDTTRHILQATGDINRMIAIKSRSAALNKSISVLSSSELECRQRIQSVERYIDTLNRKLEGLRKEANSVEQKLNEADGLGGEVIAGLKTAHRRIKMQIDLIVGQE